MQSMELGHGDLSTEMVSPYALHAAGSVTALYEGIFVGRGVLERLFDESAQPLTIDWQLRDGDEVNTWDVLFEFNGNGAGILKNRRLIAWIIGRMSGTATATRQTVEMLNRYAKTLVQGVSVSPVFEPLDEIAFRTGGGIWKRRGLTDSIYLTQNHFHYSGDPEGTLRQLAAELGDTRRTLKIEVEINSAAEFERFNKLDCDVLHLVGLSGDDIRTVFEILNPIKKPVLHLERREDIQPHFVDYFFKYCAIEELHRTAPLLPVQICFHS